MEIKRYGYKTVATVQKKMVNIGHSVKNYGRGSFIKKLLGIREIDI